MNLYTDRLDSVTYEEVFETIAALGKESQRLEFKASIPKRELAHKVCSFANAMGGIIIIGIDDPKTLNAPLQCSEPPIDASDKAIRAYTSSINSLVFPTPSFEVEAVVDVDTNVALIIVRIAPSMNGPCEFIGSELSNLPIRRNTLTGSLGMNDIEALQRRRQEEKSRSPLVPRQYPRIMITPDHSDFFIGVTVHPIVYAERRRILDSNDDEMCWKSAIRSEGPDKSIHPRLLKDETSADAFYMHSGDASPNQCPSTQLEIRSDGEITYRNREMGINGLDQYVFAFLTAFSAAQEVFYHFDIAPRARFRAVSRLSADVRKDAVPQQLDDAVNVDFSRNSFADAFTDLTMLLLRSGNRASQRSAVHDLLREKASKIPFLAVMQKQWIA